MISASYQVATGTCLQLTSRLPTVTFVMQTRVTQRLGLRHPIVLGPFGGGLSSVELAAAVAEAGGLGSFGVHHLEPGDIGRAAAALRAATAGPFALNLWVSNHDLPERAMTRERFDAAVERLRPLYAEAGVAPPAYPARFAPAFDDQVDAVIAARPAAFSFVFGVPDARVLDACRAHGIATIGTAITPDEAVALDAAGVDMVVASGMEAGGHRGAFLAPAEDSLVGTMALVRTVVAEIEAPVIAAGGIADARGVAAALALGADAVQVGTAFLATEESGATPEHRALLHGARHTRLTRAFSGRLARGLPNRLMDELAAGFEPYPYQGYLLKPVVDAARRSGRTDIVALWSGQATGLLQHRHASDVLAALLP
jgi:nitronate monooxygenase